MHQSIMLRYSVPQTSRHLKTSRIQNRWWISRIFRQVDHREDVLHHQVIHPEENEQLDNHTDAREEGKNKYKKQGSVRKKTNKETKRTGGNPVGGSFDMKI